MRRLRRSCRIASAVSGVPPRSTPRGTDSRPKESCSRCRCARRCGACRRGAAAAGVDDGPEIAFRLEEKRAVAFGRGHQPDRHSRDDAEVRLGEEAVERRADAPARHRTPCRESAEACLDALARRQNDFEATRVARVFSHWRVPETALQGIADDAAFGARAGRVHPQLRPSLAQQLVKLPLGDAGLDGDVCQLLVEVDDVVQAAEVEDDRVAHRRARAISPVTSGADWIEGHLERFAMRTHSWTSWCLPGSYRDDCGACETSRRASRIVAVSTET